MPPIEGRARELLEEPNFAMVATIGEDGSPEVVPLWVDVEDGRILLNSAEGRTWPENLRRNGVIAITVPHRDNPYEYVSIQGRLAAETHDGADDHLDALAKKYLGEDTYPFAQADEQRVMFMIEPERVTTHGGSDESPA